ncbi:class I SAM-dependent DNA methyltransferase [Marinobacterium marinum]|uniref:Methyltransferase type 12 domain-containing protein n=1 Tax=Marinobacterium marinum TaxID=2756129 RepID=A0A7W1WWW3_9GAMM|nr:methyltransferase [Marinobacterium marinum]MBA4501715.1 hypothetical protein [Marinobacterium marinum]
MSLPSLNEALALMNQGAFTAACAICRQHLAQRPDDFNARHLLGLIQFKNGNQLAATKELTKASRLNPAPAFKAQAFNNLALVLQARGKQEQAVNACRTAIQLQPREQAFHLNLLGALEQLERWPEICDHMYAHPVLARQIEARLCHAVAERHLQHYQAALDLLTTLPDTLEVESERALNLCLTENAQTVIERWTSKDSDPQTLIRMADYIAEEGFAVAATPIYQAAALAAPDNSGVRHMLDAIRGDCTAAAPADYVRTLYDTHADQFESRLQQQLGYNAPVELCRQLARIMPANRPVSAADLGCGTGLCGRELRSQLPIRHLQGCDLSPRMLQLAADKHVYDALSCSPLLDYLPTLTATQLITATDVLIYTGDLQPILAALPGALAPQGLFAFTVEQHEGPDEISLHASGRYRHSLQHIERLAAQYDFTIKLLNPFPLRFENGVSIKGLMVILQKA